MEISNICKLLGVKAKTCNKTRNKCWSMVDSDMEGRKLMIDKQIFKSISEKIDYLICLDNPTFHKRNDVQGTKIYQSLKENLSNLTLWGSK